MRSKSYRPLMQRVEREAISEFLWMPTLRTTANSSNLVTAANKVVSKDRKELKDVVYDVTRHKGILAKLAHSEDDYQKQIDLLRSPDFKHQRENTSLEE